MRCVELVGKPRSTHHRHLNPPPLVYGPHPKPQNPSEIPTEERAQILALLNSEQYRDKAPAQVWAKELDEGRYHCSPRTMYRILTAAEQSGERRAQAIHPPRKIPELVATAPDDVWSWDITKMRGPTKGIWFHAYVIIDILARYIVGYRIEKFEDGQLAAELVEEIVEMHGRQPQYLHADGGPAMTSKPLSSLLGDLNINQSRSRPKVSNDNPYSEAHFKTVKYHPEYPERFTDITHARMWFADFAAWYNHEHYHSGIGYYTPADVYHGTAVVTQAKRQITLNAAYQKHPDRFRKPPTAPQLPTRAAINDPENRKPAN
jgi:putative transposase